MYNFTHTHKKERKKSFPRENRRAHLHTHIYKKKSFPRIDRRGQLRGQRVTTTTPHTQRILLISLSQKESSPEWLLSSERWPCTTPQSYTWQVSCPVGKQGKLIFNHCVFPRRHPIQVYLLLALPIRETLVHHAINIYIVYDKSAYCISLLLWYILLYGFTVTPQYALLYFMQI